MLQSWRRDFHQHPETAWSEFRTASIITENLNQWGYQVLSGQTICNPLYRYGIPNSKTLTQYMQRAIKNGANPTICKTMEGGYTAVAGILKKGNGPIVALRFDMDALPIQESNKAQHLPQAKGFSSKYEGIMHACGHDMHIATGLGIAYILAQSDFSGTIKIIFQPAEEGVRGARSIVESGFLNDVTHIMAHHVWNIMPKHNLVCAMNGTLATYKINATFIGRAAHAGMAPKEGINAMAAAAKAITELYHTAILLPSKQWINCGVVHGGEARNIIPAHTTLEIETRAPEAHSNTLLIKQCQQILNQAASHYHCKVTIETAGEATTAQCSPELAKIVEQEAQNTPFFQHITLSDQTNRGSEDFTIMMNHVLQQNGQAIFIGVGASLNTTGHHTPDFDVDEDIMAPVVKLFTNTVSRILK